MSGEPFRRARYLLVTTFRRDGTPVRTPVWFAADGGRLLVWTGSTSGKARRLRNDPHAELAPCTLRGRALAPAIPATGVILAEHDGPAAQRLLNRKYWLVIPPYRLYQLLTRALRRRPPGASVYLAFTPTPAHSS